MKTQTLRVLIITLFFLAILTTAMILGNTHVDELDHSSNGYLRYACIASCNEWPPCITDCRDTFQP